MTRSSPFSLERWEKAVALPVREDAAHGQGETAGFFKIRQGSGRGGVIGSRPDIAVPHSISLKADPGLAGLQGIVRLVDQPAVGREYGPAANVGLHIDPFIADAGQRAEYTRLGGIRRNQFAVGEVHRNRDQSSALHPPEPERLLPAQGRLPCGHHIKNAAFVGGHADHIYPVGTGCGKLRIPAGLLFRNSAVRLDEVTFCAALPAFLPVKRLHILCAVKGDAAVPVGNDTGAVEVRVGQIDALFGIAARDRGFLHGGAAAAGEYQGQGSSQCRCSDSTFHTFASCLVSVHRIQGEGLIFV